MVPPSNISKHTNGASHPIPSLASALSTSHKDRSKPFERMRTKVPDCILLGRTRGRYGSSNKGTIKFLGSPPEIRGRSEDPLIFPSSLVSQTAAVLPKLVVPDPRQVCFPSNEKRAHLRHIRSQPQTASRPKEKEEKEEKNRGRKV